MKTFIHSINIDSTKILTGKNDAISKSVFTFFSNHNINPKQIVKIDLLIDIQIEEDYTSLESNLEELIALLIQKKISAYSIIPSTNLLKNEATLLLTVCTGNNLKIEHKEFQKLPYTFCSDPQNRILYAGNIRFNENNDLMRSTQLAFDFAEQLLDHEEMHFGHVNFMHTHLDKSFINHTSSHQSTWDVINQIKELYFDPSLFAQSIPPLSLNSMNTGGIQVSFTAAQKDTFPSHQVLHYQAPNGLDLYASLSKELSQIYFFASYNKEAQLSANQNIIVQTNELTEIISEFVQKMEDETKSKLMLNLVTIHLKNGSELSDAELIIKQQLKTDQFLFIQSEMQHNEALISIEGALYF
ncbi:hypothetical protein [Carboxylicivirga caseinilyticus]|uniref:hypothetical protein n=1 Tax=Carboxylicivirga caseinilyticus TaxID=3417572 RepID=UPI003D33E507|nr:hypothetical protein [Marinilabiliaceae bacterium A049]